MTWMYLHLNPHMRCQMITKGGGAGYKGPHQCTSIYSVKVNGKRMCMKHVRQYLRKKEKNK